MRTSYEPNNRLFNVIRMNHMLSTLRRLLPVSLLKVVMATGDWIWCAEFPNCFYLIDCSIGAVCVWVSRIGIIYSSELTAFVCLIECVRLPSHTFAPMLLCGAALRKISKGITYVRNLYMAISARTREREWERATISFAYGSARQATEHLAQSIPEKHVFWEIHGSTAQTNKENEMLRIQRRIEWEWESIWACPSPLCKL